MMTEQDLYSLLDGTADASFILDPGGIIRYWNRAAVNVLGFEERNVLGRPCWEVIGGRDQAGTPVCGPQCPLLDPDQRGFRAPAFDILARTSDDELRWLNVSTIRGCSGRAGCLTIHLARDIDARMRMESVTRSFLAQVAGLSGQTVEHLMRHAPPPHAALTPRELEIARLLSLGKTTSSIGQELSISIATVRNHIRSILAKLEAHTRTEAVLRAIREKLI